MRKVGLLLCLGLGLGLASTTATAQDANWGTSAGPGRNATFQRNGFWDNWFIGGGATGSVFFGPEDSNAGFFNRPSINVSGMVGKWYNPYIGFRLAGQAGMQHSFSGSNAQQMNYMEGLNLHADFMWNVTNYLCKYNENRFYNFIPTVGLGYEHRFNTSPYTGNTRFNGLTTNASLLNTFRITNRISAYAEIGGYFVENTYDANPNGDAHWNGVLNGTLGLVVKLGKVGFKEAVLADQNQIDALNKQINDLRAQNDELSKRPESCPEAPACPDATPAPAAPAAQPAQSVVFFRLGSATVDSNQAINVYNTAQYLKDHSDAKVSIIGYADKKTGTAKINNKLSEKRAKAVASQLVKKYGIDGSRITTTWKGSSEQPYSTNAWNRVAIMFAE